MGSIYPKHYGTNRELGFDCWAVQHDPDNTKAVQFGTLTLWLVMAGRKREMVYAETIDKAKHFACHKRGWRMLDVTLVRRVYKAETPQIHYA